MSNLRIAFLAALILIILWLALEVLFPRVTRGEDAEAQATESVSEERACPLATAKVVMDMANWGAVQWSVHPVFNRQEAEDCDIDAAQGGGIAMKDGTISFNFVYGKPVVFYQETVPVKIARILDIFRAPEAAKDQLGMKLYDVDALSAQGYKEPLEEIQPQREGDEADAEGDEPKYANQPNHGIAPLTMPFLEEKN